MEPSTEVPNSIAPLHVFTLIQFQAFIHLLYIFIVLSLVKSTILYCIGNLCKYIIQIYHVHHFGTNLSLMSEFQLVLPKVQRHYRR